MRFTCTVPTNLGRHHVRLTHVAPTCLDKLCVKLTHAATADMDRPYVLCPASTEFTVSRTGMHSTHLIWAGPVCTCIASGRFSISRTGTHVTHWGCTPNMMTSLLCDIITLGHPTSSRNSPNLPARVKWGPGKTI